MGRQGNTANLAFSAHSRRCHFRSEARALTTHIAKPLSLPAPAFDSRASKPRPHNAPIRQLVALSLSLSNTLQHALPQRQTPRPHCVLYTAPQKRGGAIQTPQASHSCLNHVLVLVQLYAAGGDPDQPLSATARRTPAQRTASMAKLFACFWGPPAPEAEVSEPGAARLGQSKAICGGCRRCRRSLPARERGLQPTTAPSCRAPNTHRPPLSTP